MVGPFLPDLSTGDNPVSLPKAMRRPILSSLRAQRSNPDNFRRTDSVSRRSLAMTQQEEKGEESNDV
jgi:hypothetical protein